MLSEDDFVADRSFGNLPEVQTIVAGELNAYDILVNDWVVFTDETLPGTPKVFRPSRSTWSRTRTATWSRSSRPRSTS